MLTIGHHALLLFLSLAFIASCTETNKANRIQRGKANKDGSIDAGRGDDASNLPQTGNANLTVNFSNEKFSGLNTSALSYKFLFLGASLQGPIVFQGSSVSIPLMNLPANKSDTVRLEIYENNQFQMVGRAPNVTLQAGSNQLTITDFTAENVEINGAWDGKSFQGNAAWKIEGN